MTLLFLGVTPLFGQHVAHPSATAPSATGRLTDAQAAELAKEALTAEAPASIKAALTRLKGHVFASSAVPERELVLYAQGTLEARLGNLPGAAVALKKLERQWPKSPFMGEAQTLLAEEALSRNRPREAEGRLHRALASEMPSERKRKAQELLIWTLVEQNRPLEALPIVQGLKPLSGQEKPSEKGLAAMVEVLSAAGERQQAQGCVKDFHAFYPASPLGPRVDLAWGRLLGRSGAAKDSAEVLRKLIKDHPQTAHADDARLALASLLTDGSLPDAKDMPSPEALLAEMRKGGKGPAKAAEQMVELRLLVGKSMWEDALKLVDRMEPAQRDGQPEVKKLWSQAWNAWVQQVIQKATPGVILARMKPGSFAALEPKSRQGIVELFAAKGLLEVLPRLLPEAPEAERMALRKAALSKAQPEAQPEAVLGLIPAQGGTSEEALLRARAEGALERWNSNCTALLRASPGADRIQAVLRLLQRPITAPDTVVRRLAEAERWLAQAPEKGALIEPLAILVADLRMQNGNPQGALAMYPVKPSVAEQRGWVSLMRAHALVKLGKREQAAATLKEARDETGFKAQRDSLAMSLGER